MSALLVIDTCGAAGFVAVIDPVDPSAPLAAVTLPARETQERLMPGVSGALAQAGLIANQLSAVAVVTGPGSFTGVRIGLAAAKGLCEALGLPVVPLSRLAVVAEAAGISAEHAVTVVLDAGRSDVYTAAYHLRSGELPVLAGAERMLPLDVATAGVARFVTADERLADGDGRVSFLADDAVEQATANLAARSFLQGAFADVALLDANYLRVPDAELALRARLAAETSSA